MNLPGIGKTILDSLKEDGLKVRTLNQKDFNKELKNLSKIYTSITDDSISQLNTLYIHDKDTILLNGDTKIFKEYLLLHEVIHAIRAQEKRLPRMGLNVSVHVTMQDIIKKTSIKRNNPAIHRTIFYNKAKSDIQYWREESIADSLSIFMCKEYGVKFKRSSIDTKRLVFIPLSFKNAYTTQDKNKFISNVRKECLITLNFIMDNYIHDLYDKKLVIKNFKNFFAEEVKYCLKQIKTTK